MRFEKSCLTILVAALTLLAPLIAQESPQLSSRHFIGIDSGIVQNLNPSPSARGIAEVVWSSVVSVQGSAWLRIEYAGVLLAGSRDRFGNGSFLRLTSLRDGGQQFQHLRHIEEWQQTSAYFNGDSVLVELLAQPWTGENRLVIGDVVAGPNLPGYLDTICGTVDDRVLSADPRAARNQPTGCTSWLINDCNHCLLTAGHCASGVNVIEFNVPLSSATGAIQHPAPQYQYSVDPVSKQTNGGQGVGNDWTYFGVFANSNTGLTPYQANGSKAYDLLPVPPVPGGQSIRVTGYGSTATPVSPTWYLVQKTHAGPNAVFTGSTIQYVTDTTGGNSGSPVFLDGTNQAIGIHTHGGCTATGGVNSGTGSNHPGLQAALAIPLGVCNCPSLVFTYPEGLPPAVAPNGTTQLRFQISGSVTMVPSSVRFFANTGGGFQANAVTYLGGNMFTATFPYSACLTSSQFYFSASDTNGIVYKDPANAPTSVHATIAADNVSTIRDYNFSTTPAGWSVANTAVTAGGWVRGAPVDPQGPFVDFDGSGQCWVTGNTNNEDLDGGPTILTTETFALSAKIDPFVSYVLWFTNNLVDDRFIVQASIGNGIWITIENIAPFSGWERHGFRVRDYFTNLSAIQIRFVCSDNPNNSQTEAAIDAFKIVDPQCTPSSWSSFGSGCVGNNGVPSMQLVSLPSLGSIFALAVQNLGSGAAFMLTGLGQQHVVLQPFGFGADCSLLVTPDFVTLLATVGGSSSWSLLLPNSPVLAGLHLRSQVIELGAVSAVSSGGDAEIR
jgi:V8-like Glu-specific endopeptidase